MARRCVTVVTCDGKREEISWYDGATGMSILRCTRLALGVSSKGTTNLLWKSGDIVDFDNPITDGATLYLITTASAADSDDIVGTGRSRTSPSSGRGGLTLKRIQPQHRDYGSTEHVDSEDVRPVKTGPISLLQQCLLRTLGDASTERSSEDERRPLISPKPWAPDYEEKHNWGHELSKGQRRTIVKTKRINADISNERTYLAWIRAMLAMFLAGTASIVLAKKRGIYGTSFLVLGSAYIGMSPCFALLGSKNYHEMAAAMQGSVHDTLKFYVGRDAYTINVIVTVLSLLTLGIIFTEMMATV